MNTGLLIVTLVKILLVAYNEEVLEEVEAEVVERTEINVSLVDHILFILSRLVLKR